MSRGAPCSERRSVLHRRWPTSRRERVGVCCLPGPRLPPPRSGVRRACSRSSAPPRPGRRTRRVAGVTRPSPGPARGAGCAAVEGRREGTSGPPQSIRVDLRRRARLAARLPLLDAEAPGDDHAPPSPASSARARRACGTPTRSTPVGVDVDPLPAVQATLVEASRKPTAMPPPGSSRRSGTDAMLPMTVMWSVIPNSSLDRCTIGARSGTRVFVPAGCRSTASMRRPAAPRRGARSVDGSHDRRVGERAMTAPARCQEASSPKAAPEATMTTVTDIPTPAVRGVRLRRPCAALARA